MSSKLPRAVLAFVLVGGLAIAWGGPSATATAAAAAPSAPRWYLALGDSLSQGVQPNTAGQSVETRQGYADDLWGRLHASSPSLRLAKLGCPGETTTTILKGGVCPYAGGSQLAAALSFLESHPVALITIDIGANDIDGCVSAAGIDEACYQAGVAAVSSNLPLLLQSLRQASPSVPIYAMNYYDPFVAAALKGGKYVALAMQSQQLAVAFNQLETVDYRAAGAVVADVYGTFSPIPTLPGLPILSLLPNPALMCVYSWMCAPAPVGPNIHATPLGYQLIAQAFAAKIA
ncbi:MAG: SGNH/GDSL hydrolase family protein [Acidimicrobiales bacterium]